MKATEFTGHTREMRELKPTPWLASEDIMGLGEIEVTIESVNKVLGAEFDMGRKEDVFTVGFTGKKKQLVLNATNRKTLVAMFGADVTAWKGQKVRLTTVKCKMMGKWTNGIRIVNKADDNQSRE